MPTHMIRHPQWDESLSMYIAKEQQKPFKYGTHDCCTFVSGAIDSMMTKNINMMKSYKNKYSTKKEGVELTGLQIKAFLIKQFGKPIAKRTKKTAIGFLQGRKGDIAMIEGCCGIVVGSKALFLHEEGYSLINLRNLDCIFRVPQ